MRIVTLLVFDPPAQTGTDSAPRLPAFDFVYGRGVRIPLPQSDPTSWLCCRYGLGREPDWPVAPLLARAAGLVPAHPAWLCADPVHIELDSQRARIVPEPAVALSEAESAALVAALDSHFSARGLRLFAFDRSRWLINTPHPARINSQPLRPMAGDVGPMLATGPDAAWWNRFLTEVQMLLHSHPVNAARQAAGRPTVNSVHLWGGGTDPWPKAHDALVASDDPLTLALTAAAGAKTVATARELLDRMQSRADTSALIARRPAGEASAVAHPLLAIDREWLTPALEGLHGRRIDCLEVALPQAEGMVCHEVTYAAFWKFWRSLRPLAGAFAKAQTQ